MWHFKFLQIKECVKGQYWNFYKTCHVHIRGEMGLDPEDGLWAETSSNYRKTAYGFRVRCTLFPPSSLLAVIIASLEPLVCLTSLWHVMITSQVYELISRQDVDGEWWHWPIQRTVFKIVFQHLQTFKLDVFDVISDRFPAILGATKPDIKTPKHYLFPTLTKCFFVPKCNESINHDGVIPMFPQG